WPGPPRHQGRMRRGRVRGVHGAARRRARPRLPRAGGPAGGADAPDHRGRRGRRARSAPGRVRRSRGRPVRILHAGHDPGGESAPRREPGTHRARGPRGPGRQPLPVYRICQDYRGCDGHRWRDRSMRLAPFELSQPETVDEVVAALAEADGDACLIAGGTALVPMLRLGLLRPGRVIALHRARGLARLEARGAALHIGAMATLAAVHRSSVIWSGWPMLAAAAGKVATPAIRSTATIGGNLGYAEAASDLAPALLCLDAEVEVAGPAGQRRLPLSEFFTGFYETALGPGELVTAVGAPACPPAAPAAYANFSPPSPAAKP